MVVGKVLIIIAALGIIADSVMSILMIKNPFPNWPLPNPHNIILLSAAFIWLAFKSNAFDE